MLSISSLRFGDVAGIVFQSDSEQTPRRRLLQHVLIVELTVRPGFRSCAAKLCRTEPQRAPHMLQIWQAGFSKCLEGAALWFYYADGLRLRRYLRCSIKRRGGSGPQRRNFCVWPPPPPLPPHTLLQVICVIALRTRQVFLTPLGTNPFLWP
jgi:hypothetical protein